MEPVEERRGRSQVDQGIGLSTRQRGFESLRPYFEMGKENV